MSEQERREAEGAREDGAREEGGDGERRNARERMSDGFSRGIGMLSALKEALEETISEARDRGDLSVDRARDAMKDAVDRARDATSGARERFDFVTQGEFAALVKRVQELEARLNGSAGAPEGESGSASGAADAPDAGGP